MYVLYNRYKIKGSNFRKMLEFGWHQQERAGGGESKEDPTQTRLKSCRGVHRCLDADKPTFSRNFVIEKPQTAVW